MLLPVTNKAKRAQVNACTDRNYRLKNDDAYGRNVRGDDQNVKWQRGMICYKNVICRDACDVDREHVEWINERTKEGHDMRC